MGFERGASRCLPLRHHSWVSGLWVFSSRFRPTTHFLHISLRDVERRFLHPAENSLGVSVRRVSTSLVRSNGSSYLWLVPCQVVHRGGLTHRRHSERTWHTNPWRRKSSNPHGVPAYVGAHQKARDERRRPSGGFWGPGSCHGYSDVCLKASGEVVVVVKVHPTRIGPASGCSTAPTCSTLQMSTGRFRACQYHTVRNRSRVNVGYAYSQFKGVRLVATCYPGRIPGPFRPR